MKKQAINNEELDSLLLKYAPCDFYPSAALVGRVMSIVNTGDNVVYQRLMNLAKIGKLEVKQIKGSKVKLAFTDEIYELPMRDIEVRLKK